VSKQTSKAASPDVSHGETSDDLLAGIKGKNGKFAFKLSSPFHESPFPKEVSFKQLKLDKMKNVHTNYIDESGTISKQVSRDRCRTETRKQNCKYHAFVPDRRPSIFE